MTDSINKGAGIHGSASRVPDHSRDQVEADNQAAETGKAIGNFALKVGTAAAAGVTGTGPLINAAASAMNAASSISGSTGTDMGRMQELLKMQMKVQAQMQTYTMQTNIAKTDHDARMSSIRNMRAS